MIDTYDIMTDDGLFCKCQHTDNGEIKLIGKNTVISLLELQTKAMNPAMAKNNRGKRKKSKSKTDI